MLQTDLLMDLLYMIAYARVSKRFHKFSKFVENTLVIKDSPPARGIMNHQQECKCLQRHKTNNSYTYG